MAIENRCIVCGEHILWNRDHHCTPEAERRAEAAYRRIDRSPEADVRTFNDRLREGFRISGGGN